MLTRYTPQWQNPTDVWNWISAADMSKYIMWTGTNGGLDTEVDLSGVVKGHAYSVISAHIVYNADGTEKAKLVRIRNPWGNDNKFNGTWKDTSPLWKDEVNKYYAQVPFVNDYNDGIEWVTIEEFHISFCDVIVAFYDQSYKSSIATQWNDAGFGTLFEFNLPQSADGFFSIEMYNPRLYPNGCKKPSYGVMKVFKDNIFVAERKVEDEKNYNYLRQVWGPGNYKIYFKHNGWQAAEVKDFSFKAHLPFEISDIKVTNFKSGNEGADFST